MVASPRRRTGFTLVELLVVIGIIAMLISILLPTLGKARARANEVKCQSNLKSLGQTILLYSGANRNCVMPTMVQRGANAATDIDYWPEILIAAKLLAPQTFDDPSTNADLGSHSSPFYSSVLVCPSVRDVAAGNSDQDGFRTHLSQVLLTTKRTWTDWTYGINGVSSTRDATTNETQAFPCTGIGMNGYPIKSPLKKMASIRYAAEVALLYDGFEWNLVPPAGSDVFLVTRISGARHGRFNSKNGGTPATDMRDKSGTTNVLFFDGHVAAIDRKNLPGREEAVALGAAFGDGAAITTLNKKTGAKFRLDQFRGGSGGGGSPNPR